MSMQAEGGGEGGGGGGRAYKDYTRTYIDNSKCQKYD